MAPLSTQQLEKLRACCVDEAAFEQALALVNEATGPALELRDFLTFTSDLVFITERNGRCTHASRGAVERFGLASQELNGLSVETLFGPEAGLVMAQLVDRAMFTQRRQSAILRLPTGSTSASFVVDATPLADSAQAGRAAVTCREAAGDGTPLDEAAEEYMHRRLGSTWDDLRRFRQRAGFLEAVLDEMSLLVMVLDSTADVVYLNHFWRMVTGLSAEEIMARPSLFENVVHEEDVHFLQGVFEKVRQGEPVKDAFIRVKALSGRPRLTLWSFSALKDDAGATTHVIGTGTDVTEFHEAQEVLRRSESLLYSIFENPLVALALADCDLRVVTANRLAHDWARKYFDTELEPGISLLELIDPAYHEWFRGICDTVLDGDSWVIEVPLSLPDGEERWFQYAAVPVDLRGSDRPGLRLAATDVTQRKDSDLLRAQWQRSQIVFDFVRDAAYEVRAPLAVLRTNVYMLEHDSDLEQHARYAEVVQNQAQRLLALFEALSTLVQLEGENAFKMEPESVNDVIHLARSGLNNLIFDRHIHLECKMDETLPRFYLDGVRLRMAIEQVLANAIRFTGEGGQITIRSGWRGEKVFISIEDTGPGVDPGVRDRVFERFFRAERPRGASGFGLGLPIALRIAEAHHGELVLEDTHGTGAKFVFLLSLEPVDPENPERRSIRGNHAQFLEPPRV